MKLYINNTQYFNALKSVKAPKNEDGLVTTYESVDSKWHKLLEIITKDEWQKIKDVEVKGFYFDDNVFAFTSYDDNDPDIVVAVAPEGFDLENIVWGEEDKDD